MLENNKKGLALYLLKVLEKYSDEDHPLKQSDIIKYLNQDYGLEFDRRTISATLDFLSELDYDIINIPRKGVFLGERLFDKTEVSYIIDALFSSKSINGQQTYDISNKVISCLSKYAKKNYTYLYKSSEINKTQSKEVLYNISIINEAIENKKLITCHYLTYDENGKEVNARNDYVYELSPYYLINSQGRYYLLCSTNPKYKDLNTFRIDYLADVNITNTSRNEMVDISKDYENFSITDYINTHIYLFGGEAITVKLELYEPYVIRYVKDWFGNNSSISVKDNKIYATIKCNEKAIFYWLMQYGEHFKILEPQSMIDWVKKAASEILDKYGDRYAEC